MPAWAKPEEFSDGNLTLLPEPVRGTRTFHTTKAGWLVGIFFQQPWLPGWNQAHNWKRLYPNVDRYGNAQCVCPQTEAATRMGGRSGAQSSFPSDWFRDEDPEPMNTPRARWGVYAYNEGSNNFHDEGDVYATVEGRGRLLVGTCGFRAPEARIIALVFTDKVTPAVMARVCANYPDVPKYPTFEAMVDDLPPDHWEKRNG